jgi:hypothetical protein
VDYTVVATMSLALILLAASVWLIHARQQPQGWVRQWLWRVSIGLAYTSGLVAGVANFAEDWIAIKWLGWVFVLGSLSVFAGLLLSGLGAIGSAGFPVGQAGCSLPVL